MFEVLQMLLKLEAVAAAAPAIQRIVSLISAVYVEKKANIQGTDDWMEH